MNMKKRLAGLGFAAALFALLLGPLALGAQSALAQGPTESVYYGTDQEAGATISAYIGGALCDSTTVDDSGAWVIRISEGDCDGNAVEGAEITFDVNDHHAEPHVTWTATDQQAISLVVHEDDHDDGMDDDAMDDDAMDDDAMDDDAMDDDAMDDDAMDDDAMDDDAMTTPGDKGDTGNAGFATGSGSTSPLLALALGVLALAGVAGARTVTGRVS